MTILYTAIFIIISVSLLRCYRASFIEALDNTPNLYCHKIFCAWDFGLNHQKATETKHKSIYRELKDLLLSEHKKIEDERLSQMRKVWNFAIRIIAHIMVLAIVLFIGVILWRLFSIYENNNNDRESQLTYLYIPIVINAAILLCSILFTWISKAEEYKFPRTTIHIRLLRNFLLEISIVSALLVFWISRNQELTCWETTIGSEAYRILIIDFFIHTIGTCLYYFIRYLIHKWEFLRNHAQTSI